MVTLPFKGHVFTLLPSAPDALRPGLDLYCAKTWLMRISFESAPAVPLSQWLDRAVELLTLLGLANSC